MRDDARRRQGQRLREGESVEMLDVGPLVVGEACCRWRAVLGCCCVWEGGAEQWRYCRLLEGVYCVGGGVVIGNNGTGCVCCCCCCCSVSVWPHDAPA